MEDKNELSDIILEKESNKTLKIKRILIIAALLILIFLVAIIVMKVTNAPTTPQNQNSKLVLPPEPIAKQNTQTQDDALFKQVPIQEEAKAESFEDMVKNLKEKEIKKQEETTAKTVVKEVAKVEKVVQEVAQEKAPIKAPQIDKKVAPTEKKLDAALASTGIYIQVGATSKLSPDKKFLANIESRKYSYKLLPIDINGQKVTKILIGPYANTSDAKDVLADVKSNINKDAFIYRIK